MQCEKPNIDLKGVLVDGCFLRCHGRILERLLDIVFIRRAKDLGFSLKEIGELLELRVRPRRNCDLVKRNAEAGIV